jgi:putative ABC transport system substrate-binding protein
MASWRPALAWAQPRLPRVGILAIGRPVAAKDLQISSELARLGYVEGRNITYEIRAADGDLSRLPALARELVNAKPNVLICATAAVAGLLGSITHDIPIIITVTADPVAFGLTDSLSRPSRNITGFTSSSPALASKRLELLRELVPGLRRIAYLGPPAGSAYAIYEQHVRSAAKMLGAEVFFVPVDTVASVPRAFTVVDREKGQAVMVGINPAIVELSAHIINECLIRDLPAIHPWSYEAHAGALMSYGPTSLENHAGAARYVDRLLKGAKVSELPFQEPTEYNLAINLRTARSIKLNIPPTLLARANEVVE